MPSTNRVFVDNIDEIVDALEGSAGEGSAASSFDHLRNADIDTSAEQITTTSIIAMVGVLVRAHKDNTGILYIGNSDVTAASAAATDGYPLEAGESVFIPIDNANKVYAIGSAANQQAFLMVV